MSHYAIRKIGPGDAADLRALNGLYDRVFDEDGDDYDDYRAAPPHDAYLEERCADPKLIALGAWAEEQPIGALTAFILDKCEQERSEVYIYDLAVDPAWRRKGVAKALIDETRRLAREAGAWVIFVQADQGDEAPIALYTKLGRREDVHHFDIDP